MERGIGIFRGIKGIRYEKLMLNLKKLERKVHIIEDMTNSLVHRMAKI